MLHLEPTRAAGLARLHAFLPYAGPDYTKRRNLDLDGHPFVSRLSPWMRNRLVTEEEVLSAVLARHGLQQSGSFVSEVFWRTYWKGWLEMRPAVWQAYRRGVLAGLDRLATDTGLRQRWAAACAGATGIEGFDHWAREIVRTGYLHNHARMWFASIWIFTLGLPWELGADFFLRHLLDGDAASNTLSWRWVGGLHTPGKTYLATAENIAAHSGGRFRPTGLAESAPPLPMDGVPEPGPVPGDAAWDPALQTGLLLTEDDLDPGWIKARGLRPVAAATLVMPTARSPLAVAPRVASFAHRAAADAAARLAPLRVSPLVSASALPDWARAAGLRQIVLPHAPVGWIADALSTVEPALDAAGVRLVRTVRPYDAAAWPLATQGYFRFRAAIPDLVAGL